MTADLAIGSRPRHEKLPRALKPEYGYYDEEYALLRGAEGADSITYHCFA